MRIKRDAVGLREEACPVVSRKEAVMIRDKWTVALPDAASSPNYFVCLEIAAGI